jgi:putative transposase
MATLLIDTLFHYRDQGEYKLHAFVVMRDHFHVLLTIGGKGTIEKAMQKIKGGFSYRARAELGFRGEIWQRGFTDERVWDAEQFLSARQYIHNNPVRKGMVAVAEDYSFSSANFTFQQRFMARPKVLRLRPGRPFTFTLQQRFMARPRSFDFSQGRPFICNVLAGKKSGRPETSERPGESSSGGGRKLP